VPDFWKVSPAMPHGAIVLSSNAAAGQVWCPFTHAEQPLQDINCIGTPVQRLGGFYG
jgi:hypothetical protein